MAGGKPLFGKVGCFELQNAVAPNLEWISSNK
jgi:hypothetical protein